MRLLVLGLFVLCGFNSCNQTLKRVTFNNKTFSSIYLPMHGESFIRFYNDSLFAYGERKGLFYSKGWWRISDNGKNIVLKSSYQETARDSDKEFIVDSVFVDYSGKAIQIISKRKLVFNSITYTLDY